MLQEHVDAEKAFHCDENELKKEFQMLIFNNQIEMQLKNQYVARINTRHL